jgi:hypothetical protein
MHCDQLCNKMFVSEINEHQGQVPNNTFVCALKIIVSSNDRHDIVVRSAASYLSDIDLESHPEDLLSWLSFFSSVSPKLGGK